MQLGCKLVCVSTAFNRTCCHSKLWRSVFTKPNHILPVESTKNNMEPMQLSTVFVPQREEMPPHKQPVFFASRCPIKWWFLWGKQPQAIQGQRGWATLGYTGTPLWPPVLIPHACEAQPSWCLMASVWWIPGPQGTSWIVNLLNSTNWL